MTQIVLLPDQLAVLRELKQFVRAASNFDRDVIGALKEANLIRRTGGDKVSISGEGIQYLLQHEGEADDEAAPVLASQATSYQPASAQPPETELPARPAKDVLSPAAVDHLRTISGYFTGVSRKKLGFVPPMTLSKLLRLGYVEEIGESGTGGLRATEQGYELLGLPMPTLEEAEPANQIEISVSADTPDETLETLHEVAAAIEESVAQANDAFPDDDGGYDYSEQGEMIARKRLDKKNADLASAIKAAADTPAQVQSFADAMRAHGEPAYDLTNGEARLMAAIQDEDCGGDCSSCLSHRVLDFLCEHNPELARIAGRVYDRFEELDAHAAQLKGLRGE